MQLHELTPGYRQRRKRIGRGGKRGKTSGRGTKGQGSRTGKGRKRGFEGGQSSIIERYAKLRGKKRNMPHDTFEAVNISDFSVFPEGTTVRLGDLQKKNILPRRAKFLKVLGHGELTTRLTVFAHNYSASAKRAIEKAGGTAHVISMPTRAGAKPKAERIRKTA